MIRAMWQRFLEGFVLARGSTRAIALIRIGFAVVVWTRWGAPLRPDRNLPTEQLLVVVAFWIATTCMLVGYRSRIATAATGGILVVVFVYFGHVLGMEPFTHHHTYAQTVFVCLLALTPCGRSLSVDRWLTLRRAARDGVPPPAELGELWGARLLLLQVSTMYGFSAYEKTYPGFLSGDRLEGITMAVHGGSDPSVLPLFHESHLLLAWVTVAVWWTMPVGLWIRAWHWWLLPLGVAMHLGIYVLTPVATFSGTMLVAYLAALDPNVVHRTLARIS